MSNYTVVRITKEDIEDGQWALVNETPHDKDSQKIILWLDDKRVELTLPKELKVIRRV